MATIGTYNEEGENVDLYIPRKCHATNTLIPSHDHSAVQIVIANVDANGVIDGTSRTFCIAGYLRAQGTSDHAINHLGVQHGLIRIKTGKPHRPSKGKFVKAKGKKAAGGAAAKGAGPAAGAKGQKAAAPQQARRPQGQKGAKPQGQKGAKPQGQKGAKPQGAQRKAAPARR